MRVVIVLKEFSTPKNYVFFYFSYVDLQLDMTPRMAARFTHLNFQGRGGNV